MKKSRKVLVSLLAVMMVVCMMPAMVFAAENPWVESNYATPQEDGWYLLKGDGSSPNMNNGPYVYYNLPDGSDISRGFKTSVTLNLSKMDGKDAVAWSFGLSGLDGKRIDEAAFHFDVNSDGNAQLWMLENDNKPDFNDNGNAQLEPGITAENDVFNLTLTCTPDKNGKLLLTFFVNDKEAGTLTSIYDYKEIKGVRYGWLFQCVTEEVLATLPTAVAFPAEEVTADVPTIDPKQPVTEVKVGAVEEAGTADTIIAAVPTENKATVDAAIAAGKEVVTEVKAANKDAKDVAKDDVTKVTTLVKEKGLTVAQYLDLNIVVKVDGEEVAKVTDLNGKKLTFQIAVPENLKKEGRTFTVVRVHDGKAEALDTTVENGIITFKTDKFSTYALTYSDAPAKDVPKTGDMNTMLPWLAVMALAAGAAVVLMRKED